MTSCSRPLHDDLPVGLTAGGEVALDGVLLRFRGDPLLLDAVAGWLPLAAAPAAVGALWDVWLLDGRPPPQVAAPGGRQMPVGRLELRGEGFVLDAGSSGGHLDLAARRLTVWSGGADTPYRLWFEVVGVLRILLVLALAEDGWHAVHAGGVVAPDGLVLVLGRSGAGKSTLVQRAVSLGRAIAADDVVYVDDSGRGAGLGECRRLRRGTAPEVVLPEQADGKRHLPPRPAPAPVVVVRGLVLGHPDDGLGRPRPMPAGQVFEQLLVSGPLGFAAATDERRLEVLSALATTIPWTRVPRSGTVPTDDEVRELLDG